MSEKIIGVTVGTTMNPKQIAKNVEVTEENITNALGFKPAPSGFGYGDTLLYLEVTDNTFEAKLEEILTAMPSGTVKQLMIYDEKGLSRNKFFATLWKYTPNYATLEAITYHGVKAIKYKNSGTWQPWEWVNPYMKRGEEYRTTERTNDSKVVYVKEIEFGKMPNNAAASVTFGTGYTVVSIEGYAYNGNYTIPISIINNIDSLYYNKSTGKITIETKSDK